MPTMALNLYCKSNCIPTCVQGVYSTDVASPIMTFPGSGTGAAPGVRSGVRSGPGFGPGA